MLRSIASIDRPAWSLVRVRIATLLAGFCILVLLFWGLGALADHAFPLQSRGADQSLTRAASGFVASNGLLRAAVRLVTEFGGGAVSIPLAVGAALIWRWRRRRWDGAWLLAVSIGGSTAAKTLVKWLVSRPRPGVARLVEVTGSSFPSGHAVRAVALYGALALLAGRAFGSGRARLILWVTASALAIAVASSRVLLGVHYVTDVAAGIALGSAWLALAVGAIDEPSATASTSERGSGIGKGTNKVVRR